MVDEEETSAFQSGDFHDSIHYIEDYFTEFEAGADLSIKFANDADFPIGGFEVTGSFYY